MALAEANVAAGLGYLGLTGALSLAAVLHAGWRVALLASLAVPLRAALGIVPVLIVLSAAGLVLARRART